MRFLLSRGESTKATPDLIEAMAAHQREMARAGVLLEAEPATGRCLLEVRSREEALEWLRRGGTRLELRRVDEHIETTGGNRWAT